MSSPTSLLAFDIKIITAVAYGCRYVARYLRQAHFEKPQNDDTLYYERKKVLTVSKHKREDKSNQTD